MGWEDLNQFYSRESINAIISHYLKSYVTLLSGKESTKISDIVYGIKWRKISLIKMVCYLPI